MKKTFEQNETDIIEQSMATELKGIEQTIRDLSNRRQLLKNVLEKVKGQRPLDYVSQTPVRKMFADKFDDNKSIAQRINFILGQKAPMTSADITEEYIALCPSAGGKKRAKTLKNISTILSIGNDKKYLREKPEGEKYIYQLKNQELA